MGASPPVPAQALEPFASALASTGFLSSPATNSGGLVRYR
jgi:hypothetical protein